MLPMVPPIEQKFIHGLIIENTVNPSIKVKLQSVGVSSSPTDC